MFGISIIDLDPIAENRCQNIDQERLVSSNRSRFSYYIFSTIECINY